MRFPVVFLALVIFTGCQASSVSEEPSGTFDFLSTIFEKTTETFRNSELGQEINAGITERINWAKNYQQEAQKNLQQLMEKITTDVQAKVQPLVESLAKDMMQQMKTRVKPQLQSYAKDLEGRFQQVQEGMVPYAEKVCQKFCPAPSP